LRNAATEEKMMKNNLYVKATTFKIKGKEKLYHAKDKFLQTKETIRRGTKLDRTGPFFSSCIALIIIGYSWGTKAEWLVWLGAASLLSNVLLLFATFFRRNQKSI
jgi:sensor c-di-GMP phosphodiesterase-like protein